MSNDPRIAQLLTEVGANGDQSTAAVGRSLMVNDSVGFIEKYAQNTAGPTHPFKVQVLQVFEINRPADNVEFRTDLTNHKLLWHAPPVNNVYPILRDGFKNAVASESGFFGNGIYFSDCVTKAAAFSSPDPNKYRGGADEGSSKPEFEVGFIFLSQVALGRFNEYSTAEPYAKKLLNVAQSVYGRGSHRPIRNDNCMIKNVQPPIEIQMGRLVHQEDVDLKYNEYVVYSPNQVRHRYLVKVKLVPN